jgi:Spy/CpxP family protein refolding chaperone
MRTIEFKRVKSIATLAAVALLTCALGVAASAHMARRGQNDGQNQAVPGWQGGQGRMGPGPGMRGGPGGPGGPGGGMLGIMGPELQALDLTDAQQTQVKAILASHRDEQQAVGEKMRAARKALIDAIAADTFDEAIIRAKAADVAAIEADQAVLQAKTFAAVYALLTPEQITKFKELRRQMNDRPPRGPGRIRPQQDSLAPAPQSHEAPSLPETV